MLSQALEAVGRVCDTLEQLGVQYAIGGSLASALHGVPRATNDADIVADLRHEQIEPLLGALGGTFSLVPAAVAEAMERGSSVNLIPLTTALKIGIFVGSTDTFRADQTAHARSHRLPGTALRVISAEDTVPATLSWHRMGSGVSGRQWQDAVGVLRAQAGGLDMRYLRSAAEDLAVSDPLARALDEASCLS